MTCPNCGKELKDGEVCTCTENSEVQNTQSVTEINEENTQSTVVSAETPSAEEAQSASVEETVNETAQAPQQEPQQQNAYYNPYDNAAYYQQNGAQYTQQAPYYVPTTQAPAVSTDYPEDYKPKKKYVAVILAATLGVFGIHNFYLGNNGKGVAQILLTLLGSLLFGLGLIACEIWVLVETVQLLTDKEDADANGYKIMTLAEEIAREQKKAE